MDLFPTVAEIVGLSENNMIKPIDGLSLKPLFTADLGERRKPIGFRYAAKRALVGDRYKILTDNLQSGDFQLYDLIADQNETHNLSSEQPEIFARMKKQLLEWNDTVDSSFRGKDYPEGMVTPPDPTPINWYETPQYQPFLSQWKERWEYQSYLDKSAASAKKGGKKQRKK
jgi:arylsulfatase A-like enzyme